MATFSSNVTFKINGAVSASGSSGPASTNLYTVPANSYLDFVFSYYTDNNTTPTQLKINSTIVFSGSTSGGPTTTQSIYNIKAGPGSVISIQGTGSTTITGSINGVLFTNTP